MVGISAIPMPSVSYLFNNQLYFIQFFHVTKKKTPKKHEDKHSSAVIQLVETAKTSIGLYSIVYS